MKTKVRNPVNDIPAPEVLQTPNKFLLKSKGRSLTSQACDASRRDAEAGQPGLLRKTRSR